MAIDKTANLEYYMLVTRGLCHWFTGSQERLSIYEVMKMQDNIVKAFRQRLVRGGFTDISIYDRYNDTYAVYCVSPSGERIRRDLTVFQMNNIPRTVWFD